MNLNRDLQVLWIGCLRKYKMKSQSTFNSYSTMLLALILCLGIALGMVFLKNIDVNKENKIFRAILMANADYTAVSVSEQTALTYYNQASNSYELSDWKDVENSCIFARQEYSKASQGYKGIIATLKADNFQDNLIDLYIEQSDLGSEIALNMYEACEHFESASRYFAIYYNPSTSVNDISLDMGNQEIDSMNEKITIHDENVRKFNALSEDIKLELEGRLK